MSHSVNTEEDVNPVLCNLDRIFPADFIYAGFHPYT